MTKISNQYSLTNILTADLANSRLGINNVSPTVALDVTGAGKFSGNLTSDDLILTAGTLFGAGNTGFSNRLSDTTLYLQMPSTGFNITDNALNTRLGITSAGAATFYGASGAHIVNSNTTDSTGSARMRASATGSNFADIVAYSASHASRANQVWIGQDGNTSASVILQTGGAERMRITAAGNVGIGTTSPAGKLNVSGSSGSYTSILTGTDFVINVSGINTDAALIFASGTTSKSYIYANAAGAIEMAATTNVGFVTAGSERMRITSGGELYWNITATTGEALSTGGIAFRNNIGKYIQISTGLTSDQPLLFFYKSNGAGGVTNTGSITTSGNSTLYNTTSDYRLKQDFKSYIGLDLVNKIKTYNYAWKSDNTRSYGVIAHELQEVLPFAVFGKKDAETLQQVDYSKIVPVMVKAIQELSAENTSLINRIEALENK